MAVTDSSSSWPPQAWAHPAPPIAHAPNPTRVMRISVVPSGLFGSGNVARCMMYSFCFRFSLHPEDGWQPGRGLDSRGECGAQREPPQIPFAAAPTPAVGVGRRCAGPLPFPVVAGAAVRATLKLEPALPITDGTASASLLLLTTLIPHPL